MQTIVIGIAEVNKRRYLVGVWPSVSALQQQVGEAFEIHAIEDVSDLEQSTWGPKPSEYKAIRTYEAIEVPQDNGYVHDTYCTSTEGFMVYEINALDLPGWIGYDED